MAQCGLYVVGCKLGKKHIRVLQKSTMLQLQDAKGKYEMGQCELCVVGCKLDKKTNKSECCKSRGWCSFKTPRVNMRWDNVSCVLLVVSWIKKQTNQSVAKVADGAASRRQG